MTGNAAFAVLRRRWRWVAVAVLLGVAVGAGHTAVTPTTYRATASVFFSLQYGNSAADLVQGSNYAQNQVTSFARLATTPAVLDPVIAELDLAVTPRQLAEQVEAAAPLDTVIVEIAVVESTPERSARLADAVVGSLSAVVEDLAPVDPEGRTTVQATTVAAAELPSVPASPDLLLDLAAGLVAGLLIGLAAAWVREVSDTRVRDAEVLGEITSLPVIGTIGVLPGRADRRVVVSADPHGSQAESFRQLRTNLQFLWVPDGASRSSAMGAHVVATTSSLAGEGKTTVATNLAVALAETGSRVLLVDADLRRPSVAGTLGLEGGVGLTTVLLGRARTDDVVQEWGTSGLRVLASGALPPNPAELLGSPAMAALLADLRAEYDHIIVDTAPLLPVTDAAVLSRVVDGTVVVVRAGKARRHQVAAGLRDLDRVDARILGVVLNQAHRDEDVYSYEQGDPFATAAPDTAGLPTGRAAGRLTDETVPSRW